LTTTASLVAQLKASLLALSDNLGDASLTSRARKAIESDMRDVMRQLGQLLHQLDPIRQPAAVFDPGDPKVVGRFIALALLAQPRVLLESVDEFYGSGVYAIYYSGPFATYGKLKGGETPIYVGQAAPANKSARNPMEQGSRLARRLDDHRRSISKATSTLSVGDFHCRSLVVQSGWETAAEDYLIHLFNPVWNSETNILFGLGKHGDDAETRGNRRSPWDTLHPGRQWADSDRLSDARTRTQIVADLKRHFELHPPFGTTDEIVKRFIAELSQLS
jgi:hypothetical protein